MIFLSGCKTSIKQDLSPSIEQTLILLPESPTEKDYQHALTMCLIERKVLYKDIIRIGKTSEKINRKFWEFWK